MCLFKINALFINAISCWNLIKISQHSGWFFFVWASVCVLNYHLTSRTMVDFWFDIWRKKKKQHCTQYPRQGAHIKNRVTANTKYQAKFRSYMNETQQSVITRKSRQMGSISNWCLKTRMSVLSKWKSNDNTHIKKYQQQKQPTNI